VTGQRRTEAPAITPTPCRHPAAAAPDPLGRRPEAGAVPSL